MLCLLGALHQGSDAARHSNLSREVTNLWPASLTRRRWPPPRGPLGPDSGRSTPGSPERYAPCLRKAVGYAPEQVSALQPDLLFAATYPGITPPSRLTALESSARTCTRPASLLCYCFMAPSCDTPARGFHSGRGKLVRPVTAAHCWGQVGSRKAVLLGAAFDGCTGI